MGRRKRGPVAVGERAGDERLVEVARGLKAAGSSLRGIAAELERQGWRPPRGGAWGPQQVKNLISRSDSRPAQNGMEYYTPAEVISAARSVLGRIDLDPCSCEAANRTVGAQSYYTLLEDGLRQEWRGRVWVNPPGRRSGHRDSQARWWRHLIRGYEDGAVEAGIFLSFNLALLSVGQSCSAPPQSFPFVVFRRPIRYVRPDGTRKAVPFCRSMAVLVSHDPVLCARFGEEFGGFGAVTVPASWLESYTGGRHESRRHPRQPLPHRGVAGPAR